MDASTDRLKSWSEYIESHVIGKEAEERFFTICAAAKLRGKFPQWLIDIRRASPDDDMRGIDAWADTTDAHEFKINVKASGRAARLSEESARRNKTWEKQRRHLIVIIVVSQHRGDDRVWRHILYQLSCARKQRRLKKNSKIP